MEVQWVPTNRLEVCLVITMLNSHSKAVSRTKFSHANQTGFFFYLAIIFHLEILGATISSVLLPYESTLLKFENPE